MNEMLDKLRNKISAQLMDQLENLPGSLTLKKIPYYRAGEHVVKQRRGAFNGTLRAQFLQHVGLTQGNALREMGLDDETIDSMRFEGRISTHEPETAHCTVDHILSLNFGGNNEFDNLVLLPKYYNDLKNELEMAQLTTAQQSYVITIVPARQGDKVPFIQNGYTRAKAFTA